METVTIKFNTNSRKSNDSYAFPCPASYLKVPSSKSIFKVSQIVSQRVNIAREKKRVKCQYVSKQ